MADAPRATDFAAIFLDAVELRLRTQSGLSMDRRPLSRWDVLGAGIAQVAVRTNKVAAQSFDDVLLDRATGSALDAWCSSRSGGVVLRIPATKARGSVVLTRAALTGGAGTIPAGTEIRYPWNGATYVAVTRADTSIASSAYSIAIVVDAQAAGSESNAGSVVAGLALTGSPAPLFDTTLLPTALEIAGGMPEETDEELRTRMRAWMVGRKGSTMDAVVYGALSVPGIKHAVAVEAYDPHVGGLAVVYAGDAAWNLSTTLQDELVFGLEVWRAFGPALSVRSFTQYDVTVDLVLRMVQPVAIYNASALRLLAVQAAVDYFDKRPDPYAIDLAMLKGRVARIHDDVASVTMTSPVADVLSPISPSSYVANGGLPLTLTRYRTSPPLVTVAIEGPI